MLRALRSTAFPVEIGLLLGLCLFLPVHEFWKNAAWFAYLACWLANRARARSFGGPWDLWDTLIAAWMASGFVVAAFAGLPGGGEWRGALDIVRYGSVLWMMKRARYGEPEIVWVLITLVASTVIGLVIGYARLWTGMSADGWLELPSVGHVNHTAIYLAILLGLCAAGLFARWRAWPAAGRAAGLAVTGLVLASLLVTASRAAIGAALAMLLILAAFWWPRWRTPFAASLVAVAVIVAAAYALQFEVVRKHQQNIESHNVLSFRDGIWRMGLEGWRRFPLFGVGMDNYRFITLERIEDWKTAAGEAFDSRRYVHYSHAHNLAVNTLAERGVFGAAIVAAVLVAWPWALLRRRPRPGNSDLDWILFGGAAAAWWITVVAGTVTTTLHHEHAILAVLLLGLWLSRPNPASRSSI